MNPYLVALIWPLASLIVSILICARSGQISREEERSLAQ